MIFRTEITPLKSKQNIDHKDKIMLIGSCFTQNIGERLINSGFQTSINPFGIIYNSFTISECLNYVLGNKPFTIDDLIENNGWYSYSHHGSFKGNSPEDALDIINREIAQSHKFIKETKYLIITLGSSWIYTHNKTNRIMGNCHKIPSTEFTKSLLSIEKTIEVLSESLDKFLKTTNQNNPKIIFTISPIRHIKDGYRENQLSKSMLHVAVEELLKQNPKIDYFPSYELMMDDLRDYRFYESDMLHPTPQAVDYIWQKFSQTYFSYDTISLCKEFEKLHKLKHHRPFDITTKDYQMHLQRIKDLEEELEKKRFI